MEYFFRWPVEAIALGLALMVGIVLLGFALLGWRASLLFKLGIRNIGRRPLRAALIVCGLTLSTTVIGSAFSTGDAMTHTFHTLVTDSLGSVDEVVVLNPSGPNMRGRVRALTQPGLAQGIGGLAGARPEFFDQALGERVIKAMREGSAIAGVAPAIVESVTVVHDVSQQVQSALSLLAVAAPLPAESQRAFGLLETTDGQSIGLQTLGPDEIVVNVAAAEALQAVAGQSLVILRRDITWNVRIRAVTKNGGLAGSQPLILVPLAQYQSATQREGMINQLLVVNHGGTASVTRSADAARELRTLLVERVVAQSLHDLLARSDVQRGLHEAEELLQGREQERIAALRVEAARPELTDQFISLVAEPRVRQQLLLLIQYKLWLYE